jgi:hypothetical protein
MQPRDRFFILGVGFPGFGKSSKAADWVRGSQDDNALIYLEEEDMDSDAWTEFPEVDFYRYRGGKRKVNGSKVEYREFLQQVHKYFRNGVLVIDEGPLHEENKLSPEMLKIVSQRRKLGIDIIILYHGLSGLPVGQFRYVNAIFLCHSTDAFQSKTNVPQVKALVAAQERIRKEVFSGNHWYAEVIPLAPLKK